MYYTNWAEQMVGYVNSNIETTMTTWNMIQEQGEKVFNTFWEQGMALQNESRKMLNQWMSMAQTGYEHYKGISKPGKEK